MSIAPFAFATAAQIRFGAGAAADALPEITAMGTRAFVVTGSSPGRAAWLTDGLTKAGVAVANWATPHEPTVDDAIRAVDAARAHAADLVIGIGGGAAVDLAKAVAGLIGETGGPLDHLEVVGLGEPLSAVPPPLVAIPTTAGTGAEVTRNAVLGVPSHRRKVSLRDARLLPRLAVVDPDLLAGLPTTVALASGLDALVQVIEPFLSRAANPLTDALCREAIPRGLAALPALLDGDPVARADMAFTSLCGGLALANAKLGAVHGLAGVIGGHTDAAHGAICGLLAAPVFEATAAALPEGHPTAARMATLRNWIAAAWGGAPATAFETWRNFAQNHGLPGLDLAGEEEAIAEAARASSSMAGAPVMLDTQTLVSVLRSA